jgi:hypothetical protein
MADDRQQYFGYETGMLSFPQTYAHPFTGWRDWAKFKGGCFRVTLPFYSDGGWHAESIAREAMRNGKELSA